MIDPESYCRDIEAYLCRKNDGHLIRIVGPAFEQVARWAGDGIPLKIACSGIDRYFERYYRKGPRRRPVRIEHCEADILDAFDTWRRAVGVTGQVPGTRGVITGPDTAGADDVPVRRRLSLGAHVERVIVQLTALRGNSTLSEGLQQVLEQLSRELETLQSAAKRARGEARDTMLDRLVALDQTLMTAACDTLDAETRRAAETEAKEALGPFRDRMAPDAYQRACRAAVERSIRDRYRLPTIAFDKN